MSIPVKKDFALINKKMVVFGDLMSDHGANLSKESSLFFR